MTTLERHVKFNNYFAKAVATRTVEKKSKKLLAMYDALNVDRALVGMEPLFLSNLEKLREDNKMSNLNII